MLTGAPSEPTFTPVGEYGERRYDGSRDGTRIALEPAFATAHAATAPFRLGGLEARRPIIGAEVGLWAGSTFRRLVDFESPALEVGPVKLRDGFGDGRRIVEFDKRESAGLTCRAVDGEEDFGDLADLGKECFDFCLGCAEG